MADTKISADPDAGALAGADLFPVVQGGANKKATGTQIIALVGALPAASTTEQLTGTSAVKSSTPDSIAALWEQGADVASSGTTALGEGGYFNITGTTTITDIDFGTDKAGRKAWVKFAGILTLTHNASTLILPTGANIATAVGDTACFVSEGSDVVRCVAYIRADGTPLTKGKVLLQQLTASSSATLDFNSAITAAYDEYEIEFVNVIPATNAVNLLMRMSTDGGATYDSGANYGWTASNTNRFGSGFGGADGTTGIQVHKSTIDNTATKGLCGSIKLFSPGSTSVHKEVVGQTTGVFGGGVLEMAGVCGQYNSATAVNAFRFLMSSGNIASGIIRVYGIAK